MKKELYYTLNNIDELKGKFQKFTPEWKIKVKTVNDSVEISEIDGKFRAIITPVILDGVPKLKMQVIVENNQIEEKFVQFLGKPEMIRQILPSILEVSREILNEDASSLEELISALSQKFNLEPKEVEKYFKRIQISSTLPGALFEVKNAAEKIKRYIL